jgi:hypothetical protein
LRRLARHVERRKEHLADIRSLLDAKELITSIEPWKRVFSVVVRGEEQLVAMLGGVSDGVGIVRGRCLAVARCHGGCVTIADLARLETIDYHRQAGLITLHSLLVRLKEAASFSIWADMLVKASSTVGVDLVPELAMVNNGWEWRSRRW